MNKILTLCLFSMVRSYQLKTSSTHIPINFAMSSKAIVKSNVRGSLFCMSSSKDKPTADKSWEFGRFAATFTYFNGNPFAGIFPFIGSKTTIRQPVPRNKNNKEVILWDFPGLGQDEFSDIMAPLDDVVMGGVSKSVVALSDEGPFMTGTTSSRNNGGFCSCRTRNVDPPFDLRGYDGIAIRLRSDVSMRYKIILRDAAGWDTVAWCHAFDLTANQWQDLRVHFGEFIPVVRGNTLPTSAARRLDASRIFSLQLMVSKYEYDGRVSGNFVEGPFRLDFGALRAFVA